MPLPTTIWRPANGEDEMGQSSRQRLVTLDGKTLITLNNKILIVAPGAYTPKPATVWEEDDGA